MLLVLVKTIPDTLNRGKETQSPQLTFQCIFFLRRTTTSLTIINHLCHASELYWKVVEHVDSHLKLTETINTVNQRETGENRPILLVRACCGYG